MLTALVLVCSIVTTPHLKDCNAMNARIVMRVPEDYVHPATCAMHGQAYLAESAIGRYLAENDRVKIVCMARDKIDETVAELPKR